jgi:hypothetical protein
VIESLAFIIMTRSSGKQLGLLLWKNYIIHKRKWAVTLFEILIPTLFSIILIIIRQSVDAQQVSTATTWSKFNWLPKNRLISNLTTILYAPNKNTFLDQVMSTASANLNLTCIGNR